MAGLLFFECGAFAQDQTTTNLPPTPPGFATRANYLASLTTEKKIMEAYDAGLLDKDEAALALMSLEDKAPMDTYGKVVDQNSQPVAGAKVRGGLEVSGDFESHYAETDTQGCFQFLGLHGTGFYIQPKKEGYDYDSRLLPERPHNYLPDPNNPLLFTMWKLHGAEPMMHIQISSDVPCDGSVKRLDLMSNKQNNIGDLAVKLTRNPLTIASRKPFNWLVAIDLTNGGLLRDHQYLSKRSPA